MDYNKVKRVIDKAVELDIDFLEERGLIYRIRVERTKSGVVQSGTIEERAEGPFCYEVRAPATGTFYWGPDRFTRRRNERKGRVGAMVSPGQILGYLIDSNHNKMPLRSDHAGLIIWRVAEKKYIAAKDEPLFKIET